ncbi:MAG: hypothetical protein ACKO37_02290 [Vampirovibrionales bacterium]
MYASVSFTSHAATAPRFGVVPHTVRFGQSGHMPVQATQELVHVLEKTPAFQPGQLIAKGNAGQKFLAGMTRLTEEAGQGLSHRKFMQDTLSVWAPKTLFTRSLAEFTEMSFLEFVESSFFYYSPSALSRNVFQHLFKNVSGKRFSPELIAKTHKELLAHHADTLAHVLPVKAAVILGSVGTAGIFGEYALSFAKNLLTETLFKKNKFSDVVGLSDGEKKGGRFDLSPQGKKAVKRIGQSLTVLGGVLAGSAALARWGGNSKLLLKASEGIVKHFDFHFLETVTKKGLKYTNFGLSPNQLRCIIALGVVSYLDAARDALEKVEVACRLGVVAPWLAFGDDTAKKIFAQRSQQLAPGIYKLLTNPDTGKTEKVLKTLTELEKESFALAQKTLGKKAPQEALLTKANEYFKPLYAQRLSASWTPFAIGSLGVSGSVALMNRVFTRIRYENSLKKQANQAQHPKSSQAVPQLVSQSSLQASDNTTVSKHAVNTMPLVASPLLTTVTTARALGNPTVTGVAVKGPELKEMTVASQFTAPVLVRQSIPQVTLQAIV